MAMHRLGIVGREHTAAFDPQQFDWRGGGLRRRIECPAEMLARMAQADAQAMMGAARPTITASAPEAASAAPASS